MTLDVSSIPIMSIITFLPLVGAIVLAIMPVTAARPIALGTALLTWVVSLLLLIGYLPNVFQAFQQREQSIAQL